jgi:E3 ubiquitin-protein ligase DOA10
MKGVPDGDKLKDAITLARTSLLQIKSETKDPDLEKKVDDSLGKFDAILEKIKEKKKTILIALLVVLLAVIAYVIITGIFAAIMIAILIFTFRVIFGAVTGEF